MSKKLQHIAYIVGLPLCVALILITPVRAEESTNRTTVEQRSQDRANQRTEVKERIQGRLDEVKKKVCAKRTESISAVAKRAHQQSSKHMQTFNSVVERVQAFYAEKQLSVSNYDQLVATVQTKKAAAQTAIDAIQNGITLNCDGDNPVGSVDEYKTKVRAAHTALKDYRAAIKELVTAVKTAAKAKEQQ